MNQPIHVLQIEVVGMKHWWTEGLPLKESLLALFRRARQEGTPMGWAHTDMDLFKCCVGVAILRTEGADKAWVEAQMRGLVQFSAAMAAGEVGVAADLGEAMRMVESGEQREYGLMGLWHESAHP
jgi:hypothetical protein